jgi:hypothetical protein
VTLCSSVPCAPPTAQRAWLGRNVFIYRKSQWEVVNEESPFFTIYCPSCMETAGPDDPLFIAFHIQNSQLTHELSVYCRPSIRSNTVCATTVCAILLAAIRRPSFMSRRVASMFLWPQSPFCSHCLGPLS